MDFAVHAMYDAEAAMLIQNMQQHVDSAISQVFKKIFWRNNSFREQLKATGPKVWALTESDLEVKVEPITTQLDAVTAG